MTDDYKRGLVTGLAMQPLCVIEGGGEKTSDNACANLALVGMMSNQSYCRDITFEEG